MNRTLVSFIRSALNRWGVDVIRHNKSSHGLNYPADFDESDIRIVERVKDYTYTPAERIYALVQATKYLSKYSIPGSIVECGVWKGGSAMAAMYTLVDLDIQDRDFYLHDAYEGMTEPTEFDISINGDQAWSLYSKYHKIGESWVHSSLDEVRQNVYSTAYEKRRIHSIQGRVEDTLPVNLPSSIAILRLDTDWYESTKCELKYLFPRLSKKGGVF